MDQLIQKKLQEGAYKNSTEVVPAGLKLLAEEENKTLSLRNAIADGIKSGVVDDFNPEAHLKQLKSRRK